MLRECLAISFIVLTPACSLILDFSDNAIPKDASIDAPYTQAECDYKEPNDSLATAAPIALTDSGPAAICAGATEDHDFYRFTVTNTSSMIVEVRYESRTTGDLDLKLYDAFGTMLSSSHVFTGTEKIVCPSSVAPPCPAFTAGDYVFEVYPAIPGSVNRYTFSVTN
jgi:hypothetical protein